jgi:hypothetical protein
VVAQNDPRESLQGMILGLAGCRDRGMSLSYHSVVHRPSWRKPA